MPLIKTKTGFSDWSEFPFTKGANEKKKMIDLVDEEDKKAKEKADASTEEADDLDTYKHRSGGRSRRYARDHGDSRRIGSFFRLGD